MAVLFFAETNLAAIVFLILLIFSTRTSLAPATTVLVTGALGTAGAEGAAGVEVLFSTALVASSLVILPSFPLPSTDEASTLPSLRILAAAGEGWPVA